MGGSAVNNVGADGEVFLVEGCGTGVGVEDGAGDVWDLSNSWNKGSSRRAAARVAPATTRRDHEEDFNRIGCVSGGGICSGGILPPRLQIGAEVGVRIEIRRIPQWVSAGD